jgi:hypothetical protein
LLHKVDGMEDCMLPSSDKSLQRAALKW